MPYFSKNRDALDTLLFKTRDARDTPRGGYLGQIPGVAPDALDTREMS